MQDRHAGRIGDVGTPESDPVADAYKRTSTAHFSGRRPVCPNRAAARPLTVMRKWRCGSGS